MYVSKEFRGKGITRQQIEEIIRRVKAISDIEQINLIVVVNKLRAKRLYENLVLKDMELNRIQYNGKVNLLLKTKWFKDLNNKHGSS
jgi:GNAT superfamily N-acetyltransferase